MNDETDPTKPSFSNSTDLSPEEFHDFLSNITDTYGEPNRNSTPPYPEIVSTQKQNPFAFLDVSDK